MSMIHNTAAYSKSALLGMQACQRDWSPYLVHFTSAREMKSLGMKFKSKKSHPPPTTVAAELDAADDKSHRIAQLIITSGLIKMSSPNNKESIPKCVCCSECNLPGLLSHSERYGRFGFVFLKSAVYKLGGRPCVYVDSDVYGLIDSRYSSSADEVEKKLFGLSNVYTPPGAGKVQDFTHEREWRLFDDLNLKGHLRAILAPLRFCQEKGILTAQVPVIPIDMLHEWGA